MNLYLDACCLNRPYDDQRQERIRLEAEAVLLILARVEAGDWNWISSSAVNREVEETPDAERRERIQTTLRAATTRLVARAAEHERAALLVRLGFAAIDALHIASAESAGADVFLTTDDKLLRRASSAGERLQVSVVNALQWLAALEQ